MPYVPPEVKERIKREVSVQRLAEARGIKLVRSGKELIGLCPFHDDRKPSLNIDPVENVWHCKGACSEGGDVIQWVMRAEGVSFHHALELLRKDYVPSEGRVAHSSFFCLSGFFPSAGIRLCHADCTVSINAEIVTSLRLLLSPSIFAPLY